MVSKMEDNENLYQMSTNIKQKISIPENKTASLNLILQIKYKLKLVIENNIKNNLKTMLWKKIKTQKTNQCKDPQPPYLPTTTKNKEMSSKKIQYNLISLPTKKQLTINILSPKGPDEDLQAKNGKNIKQQEFKKQYFLQDEQIGKVTETLYIQNEMKNQNKKQKEPMRRSISYDQNIFGHDMKQKQQVQLNRVYNNYQAHRFQSQMPHNFVNQPEQKFQSKSLFIGDKNKKKRKKSEDPFLLYQLQSQIPEQPSNKEQYSQKTEKNKYSDNSFNKKAQKSEIPHCKELDNDQMDDFFKQLQEDGFEIDEVQVQKSREYRLQEFDEKLNSQKGKYSKEIQNKTGENQKTQSNMSQRTVSKKQISFQINYKEQIRKKFKKFIIYISNLRQQMCNIYEIINNLNEWLKEHSFNSSNILNNLINQISNKKRSQTAEQNKIIEQLRFQILKMEGELLQKQTIHRQNLELIQELKQKNQELTQNIFDINQKAAQSDLLVQKKIQLFIANYSPQKSENNPKIADNIKKLNEQVEELTKLYQQSQEQNKRMKQIQMQQIKQQMEKLIIKQKSLIQRQILLQQKVQKLQQESYKFQIQKEKCLKKQKQLDSLEKNLEEKLFKIQQLEAELSTGMHYVQDRKKENQQIAEKLQFQKQEFLKNVEENERRGKNYGFSEAQYSSEYRELKNKNRPWDLYKSTQKNSQPNLVFETKNQKALGALNRLNSAMYTEQKQQFSQQQNNQEDFRFFRSQQLIKNLNQSPTHTSMQKYNSLKFNGGFSKLQNNEKEDQYQKMPYVPKKKLHLQTQRFYPSYKNEVDFVRQPSATRNNLNLFKSSPPKNLMRINQYHRDRSRNRSGQKSQPYHSTNKLDVLDTKILSLKSQIQKQISSAKHR